MEESNYIIITHSSRSSLGTLWELCFCLNPFFALLFSFTSTLYYSFLENEFHLLAENVSLQHFYLSYQGCVGEGWSDVVVLVQLVLVLWKKTRRVRRVWHLGSVQLTPRVCTWRQRVHQRVGAAPHGSPARIPGGRLSAASLGAGAHPDGRPRGREVGRTRRAQIDEGAWAKLDGVNKENKWDWEQKWRWCFLTERNRTIWVGSSEVIPLISQEEGANYC